MKKPEYKLILPEEPKEGFKMPYPEKAISEQPYISETRFINKEEWDYHQKFYEYREELLRLTCIGFTLNDAINELREKYPEFTSTPLTP